MSFLDEHIIHVALFHKGLKSILQEGPLQEGNTLLKFVGVFTSATNPLVP